MKEAAIHKAVVEPTIIHLPFPPSLNRLYRAVSGRSIMSEEYRRWRNNAGVLLMSQRPKKVAGEVTVTVELCPPDKRRRDIDNVGSKAILDLLQAHRIIEGDDSRFVRSITAKWVVSDRPCTVIVEAA